MDASGSGVDKTLPTPPPLVAAPRLRQPPTTVRGARTRAALIAAARKVFERDGYLDIKLTDITKLARCASGSFYTYFANKQEIFAAVLEEAHRDMLHPGIGRVSETDDPVALLEASNRAYLEAYRRNARLMGLLEQVAQVDLEFRVLRSRRADAFIRRNAAGIADLQQQGLADADIDPLLASRALSGMVSRLAYGAFVLEETNEIDFETLVWTTTRLTANALSLPAQKPHR